MTEKVMRSLFPIILCALVQLAIVGDGLTSSPPPEVVERLKFFATEAVINLSAMSKMRTFDSFVAEGK